MHMLSWGLKEQEAHDHWGSANNNQMGAVWEEVCVCVRARVCACECVLLLSCYELSVKIVVVVCILDEMF